MSNEGLLQIPLSQLKELLALPDNYELLHVAADPETGALLIRVKGGSDISGVREGAPLKRHRLGYRVRHLTNHSDGEPFIVRDFVMATPIEWDRKVA